MPIPVSFITKIKTYIFNIVKNKSWKREMQKIECMKHVLVWSLFATVSENSNFDLIFCIYNFFNKHTLAWFSFFSLSKLNKSLGGPWLFILFTGGCGQVLSHDYLVQTFNFITLCSDDFTVECNSFKFLERHGFDFNKLYAKGLQYYKGCDKEVFWSELYQYLFTLSKCDKMQM